MGRIKRIWYLPPMRAAKVQASLRIRAVSPEPLLLAHTSSESRGTFRQKVRSLAPLNGWACAVKICHDWMLEDTNSIDGAQLLHHLGSEQQRHWSAPLLFAYGVRQVFSHGWYMYIIMYIVWITIGFCTMYINYHFKWLNFIAQCTVFQASRIWRGLKWATSLFGLVLFVLRPFDTF